MAWFDNDSTPIGAVVEDGASLLYVGGPGDVLGQPGVDNGPYRDFRVGQVVHARGNGEGPPGRPAVWRRSDASRDDYGRPLITVVTPKGAVHAVNVEHVRIHTPFGGTLVCW